MKGMKGARRIVAVLAVVSAGCSYAQASCLKSVDAAFALDIKAATGRAEKQPWGEVERLYAGAEQAWGDAAAKCSGTMRDKAVANQADAKRGRAYAAGLADTPACEQAFGSAKRIMDFAKEAWAEKRWEDAAMWSRKTDLAWESAIEQCAGAKREQAVAKRAAARLDGHNAAVCAPLWEKATEQTAALKADLPALTAADKPLRRDQVEAAWTEAAASCKGAAAERAQAMAQAFARERGNRPLSAATASAATAAQPAAEAGARLRGDGITYIGEFKPDAAGNVSGKGRVEWDNGDVFEGSLVDGRAQGKGLFVWKSGQRYEGELVDGRPAGQGKLLYAGSGDQYEGALADGVPHGQGTYRWKNGDRYTGEWVKGHKHGRGRYTWANGKFRDGEYANDERVDAGSVLLASDKNRSADGAGN